MTEEFSNNPTNADDPSAPVDPEATSNGQNGARSSGSDRSPSHDRDMNELRRLLIGSEGKQIEGLQQRLSSVANFEEDGQVDAMGRVLPGAIAYHNRDNAQLANALGPTIEETLRVSIRRDPKPFADAIFPVIGPAIRRSIAEALRSVIESMNRTMEHSLSFQSFKWRMEAARSGRTFSEVMLAHTLNYRVEQLFLIDKQSGILIQHLFAETVDVKDSDLVSSMFSAIQDFVRDSLGAEREDVLETITIGDLTVLLEPGPDAILAAVVRGIPSGDLSLTLKEIIEAIHLQYGHLLDDFEGDTEQLTPVLPLMRAGLIENYKRKERNPYRLWFIAGVLALLLSAWLIWGFRNYLLWNEYLETLRNEPGLVVTQTSWEKGQFIVEGLKDPMATHPDSLLPDAFSDDRVVGMWESYLALDSLIIIKRATNQLRAPASIAFMLDKDTLYVAGTATNTWIENAREKSPFILGIAGYDDSRVVSSLDADLQAAIEAIESATVQFSQGSAVLDSRQLEQIDRVFEMLTLLNDIRVMRNQQLTVTLRGYTSAEGAPAANAVLSTARARIVRDALVARGLPADLFSAIGEGDQLIPGTETSEAQRALNRSVAFAVTLQ